MADKTNEVARRGEQGQGQPVTQREPTRVASPLSVLDQFAQEMDRIFDDFGFGRNWLLPRFGRGVLAGSSTEPQVWVPKIDVHQENNELVIRADLPGMNKNEVQIDIGEDEVTISGERRREQQSEQAGVYRSERIYGRFHRTIPLQQGTLSDQAKAAFKHGVLEIRIPAPPEQVTRGRRLEIKDAD